MNMKTIILFSIIFFLNQANYSQTYNDNSVVPDSIIALFKQNMQDWMNAYNGGDSNKLIPLYSEDAEYISSHVNELVAKGRTRLIENFQNGMNMGGHIDKIAILSINYSCELATLVCKYEAINSGQKAIGRNLLVLKKIRNKWLIITHMTVV